MPQTWKSMIEKEFTLTGDTWDDVVFSVPSVENLETTPHDVVEGQIGEFRMWTEKFVYFAHLYDGTTTVQYVLRNPTERCKENGLLFDVIDGFSYYPPTS